MRILFWTETFLPRIGGVEILTAELARAIAEQGHRVRIFTSSEGQNRDRIPAKGNATVRRFPFQDALAARDLNRIRLLARRVGEEKLAFRPHVLHLHTCQPSLFFHYHTRGMPPVPTLFTLHEPAAAYAAGSDSLAARVLRSSDRVSAVSQSVLDTALYLAPEILPRVSLIPNGLPDPGLEPLPLPFSPPVLLCLGRLIPEKGFDIAIQAFQMVRSRFPGARLLVAGEGPAAPALRHKAASLGLGDGVEFPGRVEPGDVPGILNRATAVLVPSLWDEPFGLAALQAAQMARPVVASRRGGLPEVIADGETGLLVPAGDADLLARAVISLLENSAAAFEMGCRARERAFREYGLERMVSAYLDLYSSLAGTADPEAGRKGGIT